MTIGEEHGLPPECSMTIHYELPYLIDFPENAKVFSDSQDPIPYIHVASIINDMLITLSR